MSAWPVVRLDEVAEVRLGRQRSPKNHSGDDMRPYLRAANVSWDGLRLADVKTMNFTAAELDTYRLEPGDLLLNEASGSRSEVGKPALWQGEIGDCAFQNTLLRVRPRKVLSRFLLHYFRHMASTGGFAERSRGVGIHHLGRDALASLPTPLPPSGEQRRIADVLDRAEELRSKRLRSTTLLDDLARSIFLDMFGDPVVNPRRWHRVDLGDLLATIESGQSPVCLDRPAGPDEWGVLKLSAVTSGAYRADENKTLPASVVPRTEHQVRVGDVLITRKNTPELVGASALVESTPPRMLLPDLIFRLRIDKEAPVLSAYLQRLISTPMKRRQMQQLSGGSAASMVNISKGRLAGLPIELPPLSLQQEFVRRLNRATEQQNMLVARTPQLDMLAAGLQHRAFQGKL
ncbi:hypothetical protein E4P41_14640 [Geodermatophilus sp. DF01-2]|uniref:restriction endonuclease subunit S n=1 Tax=Geodermatophilus sp. DF01-2 TaxID=2559610 RepID=UPI0010732050|nr:restriction endonuclease subunit S [Geodermatophilus sp. DF01_2]TFV57291.1 hypothetical protein E4P41_14640 [Geodermatophilus sp. DF01_2]